MFWPSGTGIDNLERIRKSTENQLILVWMEVCLFVWPALYIERELHHLAHCCMWKSTSNLLYVHRKQLNNITLLSWFWATPPPKQPGGQANSGLLTRATFLSRSWLVHTTGVLTKLDRIPQGEQSWIRRPTMRKHRWSTTGSVSSNRARMTWVKGSPGPEHAVRRRNGLLRTNYSVILARSTNRSSTRANW